MGYEKLGKTVIYLQPGLCWALRAERVGRAGRGEIALYYLKIWRKTLQMCTYRKPIIETTGLRTPFEINYVTNRIPTNIVPFMHQLLFSNRFYIFKCEK